MNTDKESLHVLKECAELQLKKSNDYQNPQSRIRQSDYYPSGVKTILEIIYAKVLRAQSVIEAMELDPDSGRAAPHFRILIRPEICPLPISLLNPFELRARPRPRICTAAAMKTNSFTRSPDDFLQNSAPCKASPFGVCAELSSWERWRRLNKRRSVFCFHNPGS